MKQDIKLGVIGCGKMASAILGGVANKKFIPSDNIYVYDINLEASGKLCQKYDFREAYSIENLLKNCDIVLLAIKPFIVGDVLDEIEKYYNNQLLISILAGVKIKKYESILKNSKIIRVMPNTPALVNEGMSAICASDNVSCDEVLFAQKLMENCGKVVRVDEDKIDIITALSGSGPAFYFKIIELMAKSAQKLGLSEEQALLLSTQTALGSAKMILENDFNIQELIKNVTTPGGCTEVGNSVLNNSNIDEIFDKLIKDTMNKAIALG